MARINRSKIENSVERRMATGMVVSTEALRELKTLYNEDLIEIPYVKRLAKWCFEYLDKYGTAPGKHIQDIYNAAVRKGMDDEEADLIGDFLEELSEEHERSDHFNVPYLMDEVVDRLRTMALRNLSEDIQAELSNGNTTEAEAMLGRFTRVGRRTSSGINPLTDAEVLREAFESRAEPLFTFPGEFGRMVNNQLVRGGFLGLMGKAKIGKTAMLAEFTFQALIHRCNVAFFSAGDETQEDMTLRFHIRLAGRSNLPEYCRSMRVPILDCERNREDTCNNEHRASEIGLDGAEHIDDAPEGYKPCSWCAKNNPAQYRGALWYTQQSEVEPLTWQEAIRLGRKFTAQKLKGRQFRLVTSPNSTLCVEDIRAHLDAWEHYDGWVPDVIVIDYADIMAPEPDDRRKETRDQQNGTWKALRRLSQERHCLVITATQADAESYDTFRLKLRNFSEDRRKYDHVTGMIGLNQTESEKRRGFMRVGWMLLRHGKFDPGSMVVLLQCLEKGRPLLGSFRFKYEKKDKKS